MTSSPVPRRLAPPRWLDLRLVLGVVLVLASVLIGIRVVGSADSSYRMLAVSRDLAAGTVLTSADVHTVEVQVPDKGRGVYLSPGSRVNGVAVTDALGRRSLTLNRALARGELLPVGALGAVTALTTVTVPFAAGAAPQLSRGQRVTVWLSAPSCPTLVLLGDVVVQQVSSSTSNYVASGGQNAVFSVTPDLAARVVQALDIDDASIRAGIVTGPANPAANRNLQPVRTCTPQAATSS